MQVWPKSLVTSSSTHGSRSGARSSRERGSRLRSSRSATRPAIRFRHSRGTMSKSRRGSKRRSAASSASKPPEPIFFFLDRSLGRHAVASALKAAGCLVRVHDELFAQDAEDVVWLSEAGRRGWVVLTKDARIRQRLNERVVIERSGVRAVILTTQNLAGEEMAQVFVSALPAIRRMLDRKPGPLIATLTRAGELRVLPT